MADVLDQGSRYKEPVVRAQGEPPAWWMREREIRPRHVTFDSPRSGLPTPRPYPMILHELWR